MLACLFSDVAIHQGNAPSSDERVVDVKVGAPITLKGHDRYRHCLEHVYTA